MEGVYKGRRHGGRGGVCLYIGCSVTCCCFVRKKGRGRREGRKRRKRKRRKRKKNMKNFSNLKISEK
jgi:hypothetical protein